MLKPIFFKNGLTVLRFPKPSSNIVTVGFVVNTGFSVESNYFPRGISQLTERLFWCGNDKYPNTRQLNLHLESIGGYFTSWTGYDFTCFYITVPSYHQFKAGILLADIIQHSFFSSTDLEIEKQKLLYQITNKKNKDEDINSFVISQLTGQERLSLAIQGTQESVLSVTQENILEYIAHQYRPDKSYLILAGSIEDQLLESMEQEWNFWNPKNKTYFDSSQIENSTWKEENLPKIIYQQKSIMETELVLVFPILGIKDLIAKYTENQRKILNQNYQENADNYLEQLGQFNQNKHPDSQFMVDSQFSWSGELSENLEDNSLVKNFKNIELEILEEEEFSDAKIYKKNSKNKPEEIITQKNNRELWQEILKNWAKLAVLNSILGQGISSRLWTKGVEEEILFSEINSEIFRYKNLSYLQIKGITDNTQFSFGLESILSVLESLKKTTVSINEISRAKEYLKGILILEHEDLLSSTVWHLDILLNHNVYFNLVDLLEFVQNVQAPELRALACDLFTPDNLLIGILGSAKETRLVNRLVNKYLG